MRTTPQRNPPIPPADVPLPARDEPEPIESRCEVCDELHERHPGDSPACSQECEEILREEGGMIDRGQ